MTINMQLIRSNEGWSIVLGDKNHYSFDTGHFESPEAAFGFICRTIISESRESFFKQYSVEEHEKVKSAKEK